MQHAQILQDRSLALAITDTKVTEQHAVLVILSFSLFIIIVNCCIIQMLMSVLPTQIIVVKQQIVQTLMEDLTVHVGMAILETE